MLSGYKVSAHLIQDRGDRIVEISKRMGFGEIAYSFKEATKTEAITTTGVLVVLSKDEKTIITMYPATLEKATALFRKNSFKTIPNEIYKVIQNNLRHGHVAAIH